MEYRTEKIIKQIDDLRIERSRLKNAIIENLKTQGMFIGARFSLISSYPLEVEVVQISICDELAEPIIYFKKQSIYDSIYGSGFFGAVDSQPLWQFCRDIDTNLLPF